MIAKLVLPNEKARFYRYFALDGVEYLFDFQWDTRTESWYLSIAEDEDWLFKGKRLTVGFSYDFPLGRLFLYTLLRPKVDPTRYSLGTGHLLAYYSTADVTLTDFVEVEEYIFTVIP